MPLELGPCSQFSQSLAWLTVCACVPTHLQGHGGRPFLIALIILEYYPCYVCFVCGERGSFLDGFLLLCDTSGYRLYFPREFSFPINHETAPRHFRFDLFDGIILWNFIFLVRIFFLASFCDFLRREVGGFFSGILYTISSMGEWWLEQQHQRNFIKLEPRSSADAYVSGRLIVWLAWSSASWLRDWLGSTMLDCLIDWISTCSFWLCSHTIDCLIGHFVPEYWFYYSTTMYTTLLRTRAVIGVHGRYLIHDTPGFLSALTPRIYRAWPQATISYYFLRGFVRRDFFTKYSKEFFPIFHQNFLFCHKIF